MKAVRKAPRIVTVGLTAVASVLAAAAAGVNIASYGPPAWGPALMDVALGLFPVIFPVFFFAVGATSYARLPYGALFSALPRPLIVAGVAVFAYVFVNFFFLVQLLPASAEQQAVASHQQLLYSARLFTGHEIWFFGICAAIGYQLDRFRRGELNFDAGPRDQSLEQHPLPWPLSRNVTLQSPLSAEECAQRLQQPIRQGFFSYLGRYGVRGTVDSSGFRLELGGMQTSMVYGVGRFEGGGRPTFIRLFLTFKRWPLIGLALALLLVPAWWLVMAALRVPFPWELVVFFYVFGIGGNMLFALVQMSSLLNQISRATEAQRVAIG